MRFVQLTGTNSGSDQPAQVWVNLDEVRIITRVATATRIIFSNPHAQSEIVSETPEEIFTILAKG